MSDFRNSKGIRVKTFESNDDDLINDFLLEKDGHIVNIQNANGRIVVVYEDVADKRFLIKVLLNGEKETSISIKEKSLADAIFYFHRTYGKFCREIGLRYSLLPIKN